MGPEAVPLLALGAAFLAYGIFGAADFGAGIWEVNLGFDADPRERALLRRAIGPIWETNHVWLIFVLVVLQTAFPPAFAATCRAVGAPLLLALVGILFRGAGFVYRVYGRPDPDARSLWGVVFALASTAAPFCLGAALGSLIGPSERALALLRAGEVSWTLWLTPLALFAGFFAVVASAFLAAAFLAREAALIGDPDLTRRWRNRALASGFWVGVLSMIGLAFLALEAPDLGSRLLSRGPWLIGLSILAGSAALLCLAHSRFGAAVLASTTAVAAVLLGLLLAQWPWLVPGVLTVSESAAPETVLRVTSIAIGLGAAVLIPSLLYLGWTFKSRRALHPGG